MDRLAAMRAFVSTVEHRSFAEAARALRLSRSAVSKHVGDLERDLGVQLLSRTTRRVTPTELGQLYFERVSAILADLDDADRIAQARQAAPSGLLRINAPMSFGTIMLGPVLADFMRAHPELRLHVVLSDEQVEVVQDGLDVTLRIADLPSSSMVARRIAPVERVICASPAYLQTQGAPRKPGDLRDHRALAYGYLATGNQWKLSGADGDHWIDPHWVLCANNAELLRDAAIAGQGLALLPTFIAGDALADGRLVRVLKDWRPPPLTLYAVYPPTRHLAAKTRVFIDFLVRAFAVLNK